MKRMSIYSKLGTFQFLCGISALGFSVFFSPDSRADAPLIVTNLGMTVVEGGDGNFTARLEAVDADTDSSNLIFTLTTPPAHGQISRNGNILGPAGFFTQDDIDSGLVTYEHSGSESLGGFEFDDIVFFNLSDGTSTLVDKFFNFTVTPIDDPPEIASNVTLKVLEGHEEVVTAGNLRIDDPDSSPNDLIYTLVTVPARGVLFKNGNPLHISDSFTQQNIFDGEIRYLHDGSESINDSFEFDIQDQSTILAGLVLDFLVKQVDDPPVLAVNAGVALSQGEEVVILNTALEAIDSDTSSSELIFTLDSIPSHGTVFRNGIALGIADAFTQTDIDDGLVSYQHDGSGECGCELPYDDYFFFNLTDGTTTIFNNFFGEQVAFSVIFKNGFEINQLAQFESSKEFGHLYSSP